MKNPVVLWMFRTIIGLGVATSVFAQGKPKHIEVPVVAAKPEDVSSIEAIVRADYESISGGVGVPRQWARDFSLYDANARCFTIRKDSKTGELKGWNPTQQEFADEADAYLVREGFTESEVAHKIYRFGNVAVVTSSYEGKSASGKIDSQGVNIYTVYFAGKRWWISSVSWDAENSINPIPPELQSKK